MPLPPFENSQRQNKDVAGIGSQNNPIDILSAIPGLSETKNASLMAETIAALFAKDAESGCLTREALRTSEELERWAKGEGAEGLAELSAKLAAAAEAISRSAPFTQINGGLAIKDLPPLPAKQVPIVFNFYLSGAGPSDRA